MSGNIKRGGGRGGDHGSRGGGRGGGYGNRGSERGGDHGSRGGGRGGGYGNRGSERGGDHGSRGGGRGGGGGGGRGGGGGGRGRGFGDRPGPSTFSGRSETPIEGENYQLIRRKPGNVGKDGQSIDLLSNFFKLSANPQITIYHYDVHIKEKDKNEDNAKFLQKYSFDMMKKWVAMNQNVFGKRQYVYDGWKNLYVTWNLDLTKIINETEYEIQERKRTFLIEIKMVKEGKRQISMNQIQAFFEKKISEIPIEVRGVLEVLLNNICLTRFDSYRRKYFDKKDGIIAPRENLYCDFVTGFATAVRLTEFGASMNLHLKTTYLVAQNLEKLEHLIERFSGRKPDKLDRNGITRINRLIRHLKIFTIHGETKRTYLIEKIEWDLPSDKKFKMNQVEISVAEYFLREYRIECKPYPMVKTTGKNPKFIPLELCYLVPKQFLGEKQVDDPKIQRELLRISTIRPNEYFSRVSNYTREIIRNGDPILKEFGIKISDKPCKLSGRVLRQPKLLNDKRFDKFYQAPQQQLSWVLFCLDEEILDNTALDFGKQLIQAGKNFGMTFAPEPFQYGRVKIENLQSVKNMVTNIYKHILKKRPIDIGFFIIPDRLKARDMTPADLYNLIKACFDRVYENNQNTIGMVTQCMKSVNVKFRTPSGYFDNILLKINGKVGGTNFIVDPSDLKLSSNINPSTTMVVGIDVNHPSSIEKTSSSIAAAVGSLNDTFTHYTASIRVQPNREMKKSEEMVEQIDGMMEELLKEFSKRKNFPPSTLIIFRDGVSEGQFETLKRKELDTIVKVAKKWHKDMKIMLFVVQKRHHTRFYSIQGNNGPKRDSHNVPSGTVVDNSIVDPNYDQFYITSHFSPLGTAKPTKYVVLRNDLKLTPDQLQKLCFFMCFNCTRFRGVIAIPTPIRYADLCAYRSKLHIEAQYKIFEKGNIVETEEQQIICRLNSWVKTNEYVKNRLYYS